MVLQTSALPIIEQIVVESQVTNEPFVAPIRYILQPEDSFWTKTPAEHVFGWIHTIIDIPFKYDFNIQYFNDVLSLFNEMPEFDILVNTLHCWDSSTHTLFNVVITEKKFKEAVQYNPYMERWFRNYFYSSNASMYKYIHPESYIYNQNLLINFILPYTSNFIFSSEVGDIAEGVLNFWALCIELIVNVWIVGGFIIFLFSFYTSFFKEENTIDQDFLTASLTVESEEEITNIEDISSIFFIVIVLFGWFFYVNSSLILAYFPEITLILVCFPFLYFIIFMMPVLLLYDFGILFLSFLQGGSKTIVLLMELLYDYIAFVAFFVRLLVQNVRILLMVLTFFSMYEFIIVYNGYYTVVNNTESVWKAWRNCKENSSYFFFFALTTQIIHWLYELLHTFFVLLSQFVAFFAMIFWLFLFFFTMFVLEKQESFFKEKLEFRKKKIKSLWDSFIKK